MGILTKIPGLLAGDDVDDISAPSDGAEEEELTPPQAYCLYASHFLSMWNSRAYEYGSVSSFPPETPHAANSSRLTDPLHSSLVPWQSASLFNPVTNPEPRLPPAPTTDLSALSGIAETISVLLFSATLGRRIDRAPSRLRALLTTILANRLAVAACCLLWLPLLLSPPNDDPSKPSGAPTALRRTLFAAVLALGAVEKLSRTANALALERDWIPTIAAPAGWHYDLTRLTTAARRVDVLAKLLAPLAVATLSSAVGPAPAAIAVGLFSSASWIVEAWGARQVWRAQQRLRVAKVMTVQSEGRQSPKGLLRTIASVVNTHVDGLRAYFATEVWLPSLGTAICHASVLTYSGTLITFFLNEGIDPAAVTAAKTVGGLGEAASTLVFPWMVLLLSKENRQSGGADLVMTEVSNGVERDREAREMLLDEREGGDDKLRDANRTRDDRATTAAVAKTGRWGFSGLVLTLVCSIHALCNIYPPQL